MFSTILLILAFSFFFKTIHLVSPVSDPQQTIVAVGWRKENFVFLTCKNNKKYFTYTYQAGVINAKKMQISSKDVIAQNVSLALNEFGKSRIINGAFVRSKEHHDVLFAARSDWRNTIDTGFFDFDSNNDIFYISPIAWKKSLYISSSEVGTIYTFQQKPVIALQKLIFSQNADGLENNEITDSNVLKPISKKLSFCLDYSKHNDNQFYMESTVNSCNQNMTFNKQIFNVNAGIFSNEFLYLFGPEKVYSFEYIDQNEPKMKIKVTWCSLKDFFQ